MFKRIISSILAFAMICISSPLPSQENIDQLSKHTDEAWRTGAGAEDGAYTSLAVSMLGWGLGLAVGIGVLAAVLHQSKAEQVHAHSGCD